MSAIKRFQVIAGMVLGAAALSLGGSIMAPSSAGAVSGVTDHVAVSVTPTSRVGDGQTIAIHAQAPAGVLIYQIRAHLCLPGPSLRATFDFGFQGQRCSNVAVGRGDVEQTAEFGTGVASGALDTFKVGAGTAQWVNELGYRQVLECGPGHPCDLVVQIQITNDTVLFTAPLCYGPTCPTEPDTVATTSTVPAPSSGTSPSRAGTGNPRAGSAPTGAQGVKSPAGRAQSSGRLAATGPAVGAAAVNLPVRIVVERHPIGWLLGAGALGAFAGAALVLLLARIRRSRLAKQLVVLACVGVLGACSSSAGHGSGSTSTTAPKGSAKIASLVVPASVKCGSQPSTTVAITYSVTGSRSQQVVVDGLPEPGPLAASGRVVERVHCDGVEHTVALIATDAAGRRTSEVKYLATVLPGG